MVSGATTKILIVRAREETQWSNKRHLMNQGKAEKKEQRTDETTECFTYKIEIVKKDK